MALSGRFQTATINNRWMWVSWSATQSIEGNYSDITGAVGYDTSATSGYVTCHGGQVWATINGVETQLVNISTSSQEWDVRSGGVQIATFTLRVYHDNSSGAATFSMRALGSIYSYSWNSSGSASFTLNTIPRATRPILSGSPTILDGSHSVTAALTPANQTWRHRVEWRLGTRQVTQDNISTSAVFTPPAEWIAEMPATTTATATCTVTTFNGTTQIGSPQVANWIAQVPNDIRPSATLTVTRIDNAVPAAWNTYVQAQSGAQLDLTDITPGEGAKIASWTISTQSAFVASGTGTSGQLIIERVPAAGTRSYEAVITDTRGRSTTYTGTIYIEPWAPPQLIAASAVRADADGTPNPASGDSILTQVSWIISTVAGNNTVQSAVVRAAETTATNWNPDDPVSSNTPLVIAAGLVGLSDEWSVQWAVTDQFSTILWPGPGTPGQVTQRIPTARMPFSVYRDNASGQMGIVLGDIATPADAGSVRSQLPHIFAAGAEVNGELRIKGAVIGWCPYRVGDILESTNSLNPSTSWPGTTWETYGAGRVLVGIDTAQTEFNTIGKTGGAKTHQLTRNELPKQGGLNMIWGNSGNIKFTGNPQAQVGAAAGNGLTTHQGNPEFDHGFINPTDRPHNNIQPYIVVYRWRRTS
ncbi:MAG: DUF859 family phage minor structural protein [Propionibacteriaceae bacterium]|jgi:hypothetical protein|nr:DUF859 family phage minor structural protein [Propionibacteriaceae bacterium]